MKRVGIHAAVAVLIATILGVGTHAELGRNARVSLTLDANTRLLIVAPHPDDEVLAAAGVMQRVRKSHGSVEVVYLTDGDGFPAGVKAEEGRDDLKPSDYRDYGRERKDEARAALHTLGIPRDALTFLGFPNGGLSRLMTAYWSERHAAYLSPYTRRDRPEKSEILEKDTKFRGEDLTQELALVIGKFRPTIVLVPRNEDQHVDHCAAWYFVADALGDVMRVEPTFRTDVVTYIIHFEGWPFDDDTPNIAPGPGGWIRFRLTDQEMKTKLEAIRKYKTQMKVMDWFLEAFAKPTEVFSRRSSTRVVLPLRHSPCDQYVT